MDNKLKMSRKTYNIIKNILLIIIAILFVMIMRTLIKPTIIAGTSMEPAYHESQYAVGHWFVNVDRFDVMIIKVEDKELIKRVVGLPGEHVLYKDNKLYINDVEVEDTFGHGVTTDFEVFLGEDEYYCLGDNREHSYDSRYYGAFNYKNLKAKMNWA